MRPVRRQPGLRRRVLLRLRQALRRDFPCTTLVIISERVSAVREADCILVMKDGQIIEQGTHQQLLEKKGRYYHLYTGQFQLS